MVRAPEIISGIPRIVVGNGFQYLANSPTIKTEIGKNEQDRRSFPFSSVQFMNLAHIFADFKFMIVSDCGSYFLA